MRWAIGLAKEGDHSDLSAAQRTLGGRCLGASSPHVTPYGAAVGWRVFPSVIEGRLCVLSVGNWLNEGSDAHPQSMQARLDHSPYAFACRMKSASFDSWLFRSKESGTPERTTLLARAILSTECLSGGIGSYAHDHLSFAGRNVIFG